MKHELAVMIWNEFISQSLNDGCKFSFKDLESRIGEEINEIKSKKCKHDFYPLNQMYSKCRKCGIITE
jgi:hypothetical protein